MSALFDSSVLVAALVAAHPRHPLAFPWVKRVHDGKLSGVVASHTLAETFAVLTTLPHRPRVDPAAALAVIESSVTRRFRLVALTTRDYRQTLRRLGQASLSGGVVYDALAARAAEKAGARHVLTFNERDFARLARLFSIDVVVPSAAR